MRHFIVCWTLGLLSVSWLAGCGCLRQLREERRAECNCFSSWRARKRLVAQVEEESPVARGRILHRDSRTVIMNDAGETIVVDTVPQEIPTPKKTQTAPLPDVEQLPMPKKTQAAPLPDVEQPLQVFPEDAVPKEKIEVLPLPKPKAPVPPPPLRPKGESLEFPIKPGVSPLPGPISTNPDSVPEIDIPLPPVVIGETEKIKEQTIAIKSVYIKYGSADEYQSITGQVQQWKKTWRLRYAPIDQEDPFGGSVTLEGGAELNQLRDGRHVRVRGVLIAPDASSGTARYRVQAIEILD